MPPRRRPHSVCLGAEKETAMLKQGTYIAENTDNYIDSYKVRMEVKETEEAYIFRLIDLQSRYSAAHIEMLFRKSKRVVIRKDKGGHAMRIWSDDDFTFYPFQAGIPYNFKREQEENKQEWGLVMVMPQEVKEASQHLGNEEFHSSAQDNIWESDFDGGCADRQAFNPARRLGEEAVRE